MVTGVVGRAVRREHAEEVVGAGGRAEEEQQPGRLQVAEGGDALEEDILVATPVPQLPLHKGFNPEGRAGGRVQAPTQTSAAELGSGWSAARFGGSSPAAFQTRVLPWLSWTRA